MGLSTHVLDTEAGRPVTGLPVEVFRRDGDTWTSVANATTDDDGRVRELLTERWGPGRWRIVFDVAAVRRSATFPSITVEVEAPDADSYHAALLLSRYAYTTYRGS